MMQILIAVLLAAQGEEQFGSLLFTPPSGWTKDARIGVWAPENKEAFFVWAGPYAATDQSLEQQLDALLKERDEKVHAKILKRQETQRLEVPSKMMGVYVLRELEYTVEPGTEKAVTIDGVFLADGRLHLLTCGASTREIFEKTIQEKINPMVDSVREIRTENSESARPVDFGSIRFTPPEGWSRDESGVWTHAKELEGFFVWCGPAAATEGPLEKQFGVFHKLFEASYRVEKSSDPKTLKTSSGIPAACVQRHLIQIEDDAPMFTTEVLFLAGGKLHYLMLGGGTPERFKAIYDKHIKGMIDSVRETKARPGSDGGDKTVVVGLLQFDVPPGWTRDPYDPWVWRREGDEETLFTWVRTVSGGGAESVAQDFRRALTLNVKTFFDRFENLYPMPEPFDHPSGLPAAWVRRSMDGLKAETLEAGILAGGVFHYLRFQPRSEEVFSELYDKEIWPMIQSARELRTEWNAGEKIDSPSLMGETKRLVRFCGALAVPATWKEEEKSPSLSLFRGDAMPTVVCEMQIGKPSDPRAALVRWILSRRGHLDSTTRSYCFRDVSGFRQWGTSEGVGASISIEEYGKVVDRSEFDVVPMSTLFGHLMHQNGVTVFVGIGNFRAGDPDTREPFERWFQGELLAVATSGRFELPPTHEESMRWLLGKKKYSYFLGDHSGGLHFNLSWEILFKEGGTCDVSTSQLGVFSTAYHSANTGEFLKWDVHTYDDQSNPKDNRFEVRKKGNDLWLIIYHRQGTSAFHKLEMEKEGTWGRETFQGMALDGLIEGHYQNQNGLKKYYAPKE